MVIFPNAKINLGLRVTSKREDGYHNLDTVFYPIPFYDILEIIPQQKSEEVIFTSSGIPIPGERNSNLCLKAYTLLKNDFPSIPPIHLHLHKNIPMGAGMGGGSSDAAFMLRLMNKIFGLKINDLQLKAYALQLGSDCPFFIENSPVYATGRGELMKSITCNLSQKSIVLVCPGIHISTKEAFNNIQPASHRSSSLDIVGQAMETWKTSLVNDFETTVFPLYPQLSRIKQQLYEMGAQYASMTGTGSTIFGIFEHTPDTGLFQFSPFETFLVEKGMAKKI
jgi:4-diphosphocytidyl-2-C-methyl-D-erythritol kinase